jgi:hypothetical protein
MQQGALPFATPASPLHNYPAPYEPCDSLIGSRKYKPASDVNCLAGAAAKQLLSIAETNHTVSIIESMKHHETAPPQVLLKLQKSNPPAES